MNLIIERSKGDRINLINELTKIESFFKNAKQITNEDILKLTNLSENFNATELVDNTLVKNQKRTLYILNENNFAGNLYFNFQTFINKLKRLLKIQTEIENKNMDIDDVLTNFKPVIFGKIRILIKNKLKYYH